MSAPLEVAIVGLGFGRSHIAEVLRLDRTHLLAVVDPVAPADDPRLVGAPEREAILAAHHARSLEELLAWRVPDIVVLATPIHTHAALAETALRAGANVLLEKPPTATLAEHRRLVSIAESSGRAVQIGFQARGGAGIHAIRDAVDAGVIGEVVRISAVGRWVRDRAYYRRAPWAGRRSLDGRPVMDGALTNPFAHAVDVALALDGAHAADDIALVEIDSWHAHDIETDDTTSAVITTTRGTSIAIAVTLCAEVDEPAPSVSVLGTAGELRLLYTEDRVDLSSAEGTTRTSLGRTSLLENLVAHLESGEPLLAPLESTAAFMVVLEASRAIGAPRQVPAEDLTWIGEGAAGRPVINDVDAWCARVAAYGKTFTQLQAPWTTAARADSAAFAH